MQRPYLESDRAAIEELLEEIWGDNVATQQFSFAPIEYAELFRHTVVAVTDGKVRAFGSLMQWEHQKERYRLFINVHPNFRRQGLGKRLFEEIKSKQSGYQVLPWWVSTQKHWDESIRFFEKRGFLTKYESSSLQLYTKRLDPTVPKRALDEVRSMGYEIFSLSQRMALDGLQSAADLYCADVPARKLTLNTESSSEERIGYFVNDSDFIADAVFVAIKDGEYAAISSLRGRVGTAQLDWDEMKVAKSHWHHRVNLQLALKSYDSLRSTIMSKSFGRMPTLLSTKKFFVLGLQ